MTIRSRFAHVNLIAQDWRRLVAFYERVFGCTPGHYTWTFDDPYFRIIFLRGMAWAAGESPYRFDPLVMRGIALAD